MRQNLRLFLGLILAALVWVNPVSPHLAQAQDRLLQVDETGALLPRHGGRAEAQDSRRQVDETGALLPRQGPGLIAPVATSTAETVSLDYAAWERLAERAEKAAANDNVGSEALEAIRRQMVDWRSALLGEKNANAARIATLRAQIAALGPLPGEGVPEVEEIAQRRAVLAEQLVTLQAPGLAAEEAYRRADGLIAEIDRLLRERQADQLLKLWPAPINPANWPQAVIGLTDTGVRIWEETAEKWADTKAPVSST